MFTNNLKVQKLKLSTLSKRYYIFILNTIEMSVRNDSCYLKKIKFNITFITWKKYNIGHVLNDRRYHHVTSSIMQIITTR